MNNVYEQNEQCSCCGHNNVTSELFLGANQPELQHVELCTYCAGLLAVFTGFGIDKLEELRRTHKLESRRENLPNS